MLCRCSAWHVSGYADSIVNMLDADCPCSCSARLLPPFRKFILLFAISCHCSCFRGCSRFDHLCTFHAHTCCCINTWRTHSASILVLVGSALELISTQPAHSWDFVGSVRTRSLGCVLSTAWLGESPLPIISCPNCAGLMSDILCLVVVQEAFSTFPDHLHLFPRLPPRS